MFIWRCYATNFKQLTRISVSSHLCFSEAESGGDLEPLGPGEVLVLLELLLQLQQLLAREGRAGAAGLAQESVLRPT